MIDVTKDLLEALKIVTSQLERVGDTRRHKDGEFIDLGRAAIARAEAELAEPQPDADGWIPWAGTDCPEDEDVVIEVRLRSGTQETKNAGFFDWKHYGWKSDIVAYRVVEAQP